MAVSGTKHLIPTESGTELLESGSATKSVRMGGQNRAARITTHVIVFRHRHRADTTRCYSVYKQSARASSSPRRATAEPSPPSNRHAPRHHRAARLLNRHHHRAVRDTACCFYKYTNDRYAPRHCPVTATPRETPHLINY
ncbi:hypothetical protein J6590_075852 [Homalodisca vitripennis]|nr:hypothetical protein J6590_075852 [Homalodisca vitripennis]